MKYEGKLITVILLSTAAALALIAGLTFTLVPDGQGGKINVKQHTFSGRVLNAKSQAIADARITIFRRSDMIQANDRQSMNDDSGLKTVTTDDEGKFKIGSISPGIYTHKVEADGYETFKQPVTINEDKSLTITLQPDQQ